MPIKSKITFISLGCPKALVDTEEIITQLRKDGYDIVSDHKKAHLAIVNTCGFINDAIDESLDSIGEALSTTGKVIVTGCLGVKKDLILQKHPQVLHITGPNPKELIKAVHKYFPIKQQKSLSCPNIQLTPSHYAYLKISEGCNHRCTYCIIPDLRGKLVSKPIDELLKKAEQLIKNGVKELIIISQDTGAYGTDLKDKKSSFIDLIKKLGELGIWIRLHYLYPYPFLDDIIPLMADKKILPYLDIPLQHVNKRILNLMQRPAHKDDDILKRIEKWRQICPDLIIRSTFIVGFPTETQTEFKELLTFLKEAQLDRVGCFKYSPVNGAKANTFKPQITEATKDKRLHQLMTLQQDVSYKKLQTKIGTTIEVLVDDLQNNLAVARSYADSPEIDGEVLINDPPSSLHIGDFAKVKIISATEYDLVAKL